MSDLDRKKIFFKVLVSWDILAAGAVSAAVAALAAQWLPIVLVKDLYGLGTTVLAILFSVFFACLTIIMASSDDEFVKFLEQVGQYTELIATFRFTLSVLFLALSYSIFMYIYTSVRVAMLIGYQSKWWAVGFCFLGLYGLFAAFEASLDSLTYAKFRVRFLANRRVTDAVPR